MSTDDGQIRIGIVYSETSAQKYFSGTAYSQLFMSAQNQALMAGIPFDILSESDLLNIDTLKSYDTLVFPSFSYVKQSDVAAITATLTEAVYTHGISLITAGNFMTNDETGAALAGDSYARMKSLLGVQPQGVWDSVSQDTILAAGSSGEVIGYQPGELIHTYLENSTSKVGTATFVGVDASAVVVATQTTVGGNFDGTYNAVLATQTGARNVFFTTEGMLADSNMLGHAMDWTTRKVDGPELSLHMSRHAAIVASRVDMDQAMEAAAVNPADGGPGIYDLLVPILEQWKTDYGFVGSFYIDIGNNVAQGQYTDWSVSAPYYQAIAAMGSEIGSHSITHPDNTNLLTGADIQYEFQQSKALIEQQLGITVPGAAVPGAPESVQTAQAISQYYSYISGGYAGIGAGYPGAIGSLTSSPTDSQHVYIAPNMKFDFSLVEAAPAYGGGMTAAQAEQEWYREFDEIASHADLPVVVWPWHDYGVTQWQSGAGVSPYTTEMYTNFVRYAYEHGSEFVTLADLATRVSAAKGATFNYAYTPNGSGGAVTVSVTAAAGATLGKLAVDLAQGSAIASVEGWYAYDADSIFLPATGGTFTVNLLPAGAVAADVTHITALPMRADLVSLGGDGQNLAFSVTGEGHVVLDLAALDGRVVTVNGADVFSLDGERLELALNGLGQHDVAVTLDLAAPTGLALNASTDTGVKGDGITSIAMVTIDGTATPGTTVNLVDGDTIVGSGAADTVSGAFSVQTSALADGMHLLTAVATDGTRSSAASSVYGVTVDTLAPTEPTIAISSLVRKSGTFTLQGSAEAGSTVGVYDGTLLGSTVADASGHWAFTTGALPTRVAHTFTASSTDAAGNLGAPSGFAYQGTSAKNTVASSTGSDRFTGSGGADTFIFDTGFGNDTVTDFKARGGGHDMIRFDKTMFATYADVMTAAQNEAAGVVITHYAASGVADATLTLAGVHKADLSAADFLFFA